MTDSAVDDERLRRRRAIAREVLVVGFFAVLASAWWWPLPRHLGDGQLEQPIIDSGFNQWIIGWGAHVLPRDPLSFFDANMYHPRANVLAWGDHLFAVDLLAVPLVPLLGLVKTYNVLLLAFTAVSGYGASLWLRRVGVALPVAIAAGAVWLCTNERVVEYSHIQSLATWSIPFVFLLFERVVSEVQGEPRGRRRSWLDVVGLGVAAWWTLATNVYLGLFTALSFTVYGLGAWAIRRIPLRTMIKVGIAWVVAVVVALPLYLPSLRYQRAEGVERAIDEQVGSTLREMVPWPFPGKLAQELASAVGRPYTYRGHHAPDLVTWGLLALLAVTALVLRRRWKGGARLAVPAVAAGAFALIAAMGPNVIWRDRVLFANPLFHALYAVVPGYKALRVPPRWLLLASLLLLAAAAPALSRVLERRHLAMRWAIPFVLVAVAFVEQAHFPFDVFPSPRIEEHPSYAWLAEQPGDFPILEYPISANLASATTQALEARRMWFSTMHWKRRVGGAVSPVIAKQYELDAYVLQGLGADPKAMAMLRRWDVKYVLVFPADLARYPEFGPVPEVLARIAATDGLVPAREFPDAIVYEVTDER
ncbi:MAG TPA: hypothetical protein VF230_11420 [Acidimicrobiales bacterium]